MYAIVVCLRRSALLAFLLLPLYFAPQNTTAENSSWADDIIGYATRSLENPRALSVAAVPLNGPGAAQYVNADMQMTPGSIMKVITTYAALDLLGPNYTWHTDFLTAGNIEGDTLKGNLYLRFGGDPKLSVERLWVMLSELKGMGIRAIEGDLVLDGSFFRLKGEQPAFKDNGDDPYAPFLVEPSGYLANFNLQQFHVLSDERGLRAWAFPELPQVGIDNQIKVTAPAPCPGRKQVDWKPVYLEGDRVTLRLSGQLPRGCRLSNYLSLLPQEIYTASLVRSQLAELGVTISGSVYPGETPGGSKQLVSSTSADLVTTVRDINKWSSNVMARQLLLTIGAAHRDEEEQDDRKSGVREILKWMQGKGIDTAGIVIENGAGLTRDGRITASQVTQLLQQVWNSPYQPDLLTSMPIIAMDGTMTKRLKNTGLEGEGRIKTGYLEHVRSVAGFIRDRNNTTWAVVAMVNSDPAWNGQAVLDRVLYSLHFHPPSGPSLTQRATTEASPAPWQ